MNLLKTYNYIDEKNVNTLEAQLQVALELAEKIFRPKTQAEREKHHNFADWKKRFSQGGTLITAFSNNVPAGFAICYQKEPESLHIWNAGVLPKYRNKGIWRDIYSQIIQNAHADKIKRLTINTYPEKFPAMYTFLQKNGFHEYKTTSEKSAEAIIKKSYFEKSI